MTALSQTQTYETRAGLVEVNAFTVAGVSVLTDRRKAAEDINALWERFFSEKIGQKLEDRKADDVIYAIYSDYEGDHEQPYRVTIGYRVKSPPASLRATGGNEAIQQTYDSGLLHPPDGVSRNDEEGFDYVKCTSGPYALLSAVGPQPKALMEAWEAIWSSDLDRTYKTDFEAYGPRFFEEGLHEVLIHVGVKT